MVVARVESLYWLRRFHVGRCECARRMPRAIESRRGGWPSPTERGSENPLAMMADGKTLNIENEVPENSMAHSMGQPVGKQVEYWDKQ
jgi:hypothetical protein